MSYKFRKCIYRFNRTLLLLLQKDRDLFLGYYPSDRVAYSSVLFSSNITSQNLANYLTSASLTMTPNFFHTTMESWYCTEFNNSCY